MNRPRRISAPRWDGAPIEAVLLDLDGTLIDSVPGIATALNSALGEMRLGPLPIGQVRTMIGGGAAVLTRHALVACSALTSDAESDLLRRYLHHYDELLGSGDGGASVFEGVTPGLQALRDLGLRLAVVTNKHGRHATTLLQKLGLTHFIDLVIGGDTCEWAKPHPQSLQVACAVLNVDVRHAVMVGDSSTDVRAARAAGMPVFCVGYGYGDFADPAELGADAVVRSIADIPSLLTGTEIAA